MRFFVPQNDKNTLLWLTYKKFEQGVLNPFEPCSCQLDILIDNHFVQFLFAAQLLRLAIGQGKLAQILEC